MRIDTSGELPPIIVRQTNVSTFNNTTSFNKDRPREVVFYGRVSSEHEAQLAALENQLQWYDDQASYHQNWRVHHKYVDEGITGTQAKKRPAFMEMIEDAKNGMFDLIVTREVCRFARNTVDTLVVTRELKKYGVEVYFVEDNIWTMDGDGELRLTLMATLAQEESRKTSERVRAGQKISRDKGVLYGNGNILGYQRVGETYVINEEQAETVRLIYDLYLQGLGFMRIINELTRLKRLNASGRVKWDCTTISRILHNATYKGYKCYLKSWRDNFLDQKIVRNNDEDSYMYVKGDFEPIISEEVWDKCRAIRQEKTKKRISATGEVIKTGDRRSNNIWVKKLVCKCGHHFRMDKWHTNRNGVTYGYKCYNILNNSTKKVRLKAGLSLEGYCDMGTIADWKMDMMAWHVFKNLKFSIRNIAEKADETYDVSCKTNQSFYAEEIATLNEKLAREKVKLENLTDMRVSGEISKEEYANAKYKINTSIIALEQRLDEIRSKTTNSEQASTQRFTVDDIIKMVEEEFDFSTPTISRNFVETFVEKIVPEDVYTFNWYLSLSPRSKMGRYECVDEFVINFEEAKSFRKMRGEILRPSQYTEIKVKVYA